MIRKIFILLTSVLMMINVMTFNIKADEQEESFSDTETVVETVEQEEGTEEETVEVTQTDETTETQTDEESAQTGEENTENTDNTQTGENTETGDNTDDPQIGDELTEMSDEDIKIEIKPVEGDEEGQEDSDEIIIVDLSDYIIQSGGYETASSDGTEIEAYGTGDETLTVEYTRAEQAIMNALKARKGSINLSGYKLSDAQLTNGFFKVINENADMFYVVSQIGWNRSGGYVNNAYFYYYNYTQADIDLFNAAVDSIIAKVDPAWSDLQKAMYLHDWVESNCTYDYSYSRYNAYNVIVDGLAVCQGYALAYSLLCKRAGVQCQVITSRAINHAWNVMKLGDEFFYLDTTWDDYTGVMEHFSHDYFLCSRDQFYNKGHDCTDWKLNNVSNAYNGISTSTRYDDAFWKEVDKPLCMYGDYTVYFYSDLYDINKNAIVVYDMKNDQEYRRYAPVGDKYEYGSYFHAVADGRDQLYISSAYDIYSLNIHTGEQQLYYSLSDGERAYGNIYALAMKNHKVQYKMSNDWGQTYSLKGTIGAETLVRQNASDNAVIIASDDEGLFTYLKQYGSTVDLIVNPGSYNEEKFTFNYFENEDLETQNYYYDVISPFKEDEYASISWNTLRNRSVPSGNAVVEFEYNGKPYRSPEFYLSASSNAPSVTITESGDKLIISSSDIAYLKALVAPEILNYKDYTRQTGGLLKLTVDGRECSIGNVRIVKNSYDKTSTNLVYNNGSVTISKEALVNSGVINGSNVTASLYVNGYAKKDVTVYSGISLGICSDSAVFNIYQNSNNDIIIESNDTDWLMAMTRSNVYTGANKEYSFDDYGWISGKYQNFTIGGVSMDFSFKLMNEKYDDHEDISYYYSDGKIIIPASSLNEQGIPGGTYDLTIHAPGYVDNDRNDFVISSTVSSYIPSDLKFYNDPTYGIMVQTSDSEWLRALESGKITVYDYDDNEYVFDTANCFARMSYYDDVTYVSMAYLAGAGIRSGNYKVLLQPENHIAYGVRYTLTVDSSIKKMFTVKFFDDDNNLLSAVGVKQGANAKAAAPKNPTKQGYTFAGWMHKGNIINISKAVNENMDLYYGWKENTYKLAYNANGGKGTLEKAKTHSLNERVLISDLVPYKNGYDFLGWSLDKKATVPTYYVGDDITAINYNSKNNATITLYAVYSDPVDYDLTLDPRGGVLANKQVYDARLSSRYDGKYEAVYNITSAAFKLPNLVKDGYKFNGWYDSATGKKVSNVSKGSYGNKDLYAMFTPVQYKLSYSLNKGSFVKGEVYDKSFSIETVSLNLPVPTRKGYEFKGWYLDKALTVKLNSVYDLAYKNTTLYAKWEAITYKIVFEYNGQRYGETTLTYDVNQTVTAPEFEGMIGKTPSKYSYVNDAGKIVSIGSLKLKNLTAVKDKTVVITPSTFKYVTYKVKYVLNGGKNVSSNKTSYNVDKPITLAPATKKNCIFLGWYDNPEFNGEALTKLPYGNYTLYACFNEGGFFASSNPSD